MPTSDAARRSEVLEALNNGTPSLRWVGLLAIPHTGPIDEEVFPALLRQTGTGLPYLDTAAQTVLETAAGVTEGAATRMWLVARTAPARLRAALYRSLATHRPADGRKEVLREALRASDPGVRRAAAFALLQLLPDVPPHPHPHADLLEGLSQAGADARLVLDDIRHLSEHADANVRRAASVLLDLLGAR